MKNILITGGAGFIGSHLVDRLLSEGGFRITVVDSFNDFYDPAIKRANVATHLGRPEFRLIEADVSDEQAVGRLFDESEFQCVVHLAARAGVRPSLESPLAYENSNVRGTYVLLEAVRRSRVPRLVFGSSSSVYGVNSKIPFSEDDPVTQAISPYAATKLAGEAACQVYSHLYGINVVCLRFFTVYGPRQRPDLAIHKFAGLISQGLPIPIYGDGSTRRDYTYIDDIISGVVSAMNYEGNGFETINLGESETVELRRLVDLLEQALDRRAILDHQPLQPGDVPLTHADIEKARRLLGYAPATSIEAGIPKFVEWFKRSNRPGRQTGS
jgi:UDP-glucuronate 4-epimerase